MPALRGFVDEQAHLPGVEQARRRDLPHDPVHRHGSRRKGCGNTVRMEVVDAAVNEIMATTFRVRVKRLILVKGTDYQDQLEVISYRIRALDPDAMSDEQFDEQVRRLRAERDRLKALPAEPDRWDGAAHRGSRIQTSTRRSPPPSAARGSPRTGSWSTRRRNRSA